MLKNKTKNTVVFKEIILAKGFNKVIGLIGKDKPKALVLNTHFGIHTFFVKFPIDVLILDKNLKVKTLREKLEPNKIMFWNFRYGIVVELPNGSIKKSKTTLNDSLEFSL